MKEEKLEDGEIFDPEAFLQNLKLEYLPEKSDPLVGFDCTSMINSSIPPQPEPPAMTRQDTDNPLLSYPLSVTDEKRQNHYLIRRVGISEMFRNQVLQQLFCDLWVR